MKMEEEACISDLATTSSAKLVLIGSSHLGEPMEEPCELFYPQLKVFC